MKRSLARSFANAFRGLLFTFKTERNFRIHVYAMILAIVLGIYLRLTAMEWGLIMFAIGFVLTAELFNTALERWCDEAAGGKQSEIIKHAKDVSSAAVLVAAIVAGIIGVLVLFVPLIEEIF